MIVWLINRCIENRVLVLLLALVLIAAGIWGAATLRVDAIPDLSDVQIIIRTDYPGQAPQIVEDQVTYPLSTAMLQVPHARTVRGSSMFGMSFVFVIFEDGTDLYWARSRVLEQLASVGDQLPAGVRPQIGPDATGVGWIYQYVLVTGRYSPAYPQGLWQEPGEEGWFTAPDPAGRRVLHRVLPESVKQCPITGQPLQEADQSLADLRSLQDWFLRYELAALPGVAEVASVGGYQKQYQVVVDPLQLQQMNVSIDQVRLSIAAANLDTGGGAIELGEVEAMVRSRGYLGTDREGGLSPTERVLEDLRHVGLGVTEDGTPILLDQVARVEVGPAMRRGLLEWNGRGETAGGIIVMRSGENARATIQRVREKIDELQQSLPPGVAIEVGYDRSDLIDRSVATLTHTLVQEVLVVALVCILFLLHARSELVAVVVVPTGILASLLLMRLLGINANIMSLGGLAIAIGVMVDSSIIMVENAHKHLDRLEDLPEDQRPPLHRVMAKAASEVGPSLFFSLLIITVSFLPVFALDQQSGRLFKPLAYTKTFAMAWASVLAVTLVPVLMSFLIRPRLLPRAWGRLRSTSVTLAAMLLPAVVLYALPLAHLEAWRPWLVLGWIVGMGMLLVPQKLIHEKKNPLSRLLQWSYEPFFRLAIRWHWPVIVASLLLVASIAWPLGQLGNEFMPPLEEGDLLYMPTTDPGLSVGKAQELLQQTDKLIASFPEVASVLGKAGAAETATDPAPLNMFESVITLHRDPKLWRHVPAPRFFDHWPQWTYRLLSRIWPTSRPITLDELIYGFHLPDEEGTAVPGLNDVLQIPGLTNSWTMPIRTRIDMLSTGIRTPVGVKVMGSDLAVIDDLATQIAALLRSDPRTAPYVLSAFPDRNTGGYYLDLELDRLALARQGLSVQQVQAVIESAIGGHTVTTVIEGLERYPVSVRYPRELREDVEAIRQVLVQTPGGAQVPLEQLARIRVTQGPPMIRSENARRTGWIYVDIAGRDVGSFVADARHVVAQAIELPAGTSLIWSGQYEYMQEARQRLMLIIPITAVIIVILLYMATRSWARVAMVVLAMPFLLVGAFWLVYLLDYNLSLAVWVGVIALAGLDAETSLVMLLYLDNSFDRFKAQGRMRDRIDLWHAVHDGAVMRIRPKTMTVATTFIGLLPLMWAGGAGADTLQRLAAPMIGGLVTSFLLELLIYPAIYYAVRAWRLPREMAG